MRQLPLTRAGRTCAGLGAGIVVAAGLALVATPAANAAPVEKTVLSHTMTFGDTRATGHNDFLEAGGVRVWTEGGTSTDKAAGYFDADQPLSEAAATEPTLDWTAATTEGANASNLKPGLQLVTDFDGDGTVDGILVGEPTYANGTALYGDVWWLNNAAKQFVKDAAPATGGGYGSSFHGTLDQWLAEFGDARIVYGGWSLGSGVKGDGVINDISIGETTYAFDKSPAATTTTLYRTDVDTSETRATGHNDFLETGGVRVYTEGATSTDKAAGYFDVDQPLADAGEPRLDWTGTGGRPGAQLVMDFDGDGAQDGILVGEPVYGNDWWLTNGSQQFVKDAAPSHTGGFGSENHGVLAQWRTAFPEAVILEAGWSLGSGVLGDGVISKITVGLDEYVFSGANRAPVAPAVTATTVAGVPAVVTLPGTDPDGDELTYAAEAGTVDGDTLTIPVPKKFVGVYRVDYTVTDGTDTTEGAVLLRVTKAPSRVRLEITPQAITTATRGVRAVATVTSTGFVDGVVRFFDGDRRVGLAEVRRNGTAVLRLGQQTRGAHTYRAVYAGNSFTLTDDATKRKFVRRR